MGRTIQERLAADHVYRSARKSDETQRPLIVVRNKCIEALAALPDPEQALAVVDGIRRSITEFIAVRARGP